MTHRSKFNKTAKNTDTKKNRSGDKKRESFNFERFDKNDTKGPNNLYR